MLRMTSWRVLVLLVLSVLLPWRSAMAITMPVNATPAPPTATHAPSLADTHGHAAVHALSHPVLHADAHAAAVTDGAASCPHHAALDGCTPTVCHDSPNPDSSHSHSLCDVCNGPALGPVSALPLPTHASPVGPAHGAVRFASRALPIGHKPPIPA